MEMNKICENCSHFRTHYVKHGKQYQQINDGHCVYPRLKRRETNTKACEHWKELKK